MEFQKTQKKGMQLGRFQCFLMLHTPVILTASHDESRLTRGEYRLRVIHHNFTQKSWKFDNMVFFPA